MQFLLTEPHHFTGVAEADWLALEEQQILESLPPVQVRSHVAQVGLQAPFPSISGAVNAIGAIQAELPEDARNGAASAPTSISPTDWSSTDASLKFVVSKSAPKLEALSPDQPQR